MLKFPDWGIILFIFFFGWYSNLPDSWFRLLLFVNYIMKFEYYWGLLLIVLSNLFVIFSQNIPEKSNCHIWKNIYISKFYDSHPQNSRWWKIFPKGAYSYCQCWNTITWPLLCLLFLLRNYIAAECRSSLNQERKRYLSLRSGNSKKYMFPPSWLSWLFSAHFSRKGGW